MRQTWSSVVFWTDKKVQAGKDQEKAQSERDSHSKKPRWDNQALMP